jgi:hypothetical protein
MAELSQRSKKLLRRAGWFEGRTHEVAEFVRLLELKGYPVFPAVVGFLKKFGGLRIENPSAKRPAAEDWHFDVAKASRNISLSRIQALYVPRVHSNLCIIGEADKDYITLMMDEKGRVYGGFEETLVFLGESGEDAIDQLGSENYARPIDEPGDS